MRPQVFNYNLSNVLSSLLWALVDHDLIVALCILTHLLLTCQTSTELSNVSKNSEYTRSRLLPNNKQAEASIPPTPNFQVQQMLTTQNLLPEGCFLIQRNDANPCGRDDPDSSFHYIAAHDPAWKCNGMGHGQMYLITAFSSKGMSWVLCPLTTHTTGSSYAILATTAHCIHLPVS